MNKVLVQNAQHDVDGYQRRQNQIRLGRQRSLKRLRRSLKAPMDRGWQNHRALRPLNRFDRIAQRHTGSQVEGDGDCRKLSLMRYRQRRRRWRVMRKRSERNRLSRVGPNVDVFERIRALLELRIDLHQRVVLIEGLVQYGNISLAKGRVKRAVN